MKLADIELWKSLRTYKKDHPDEIAFLGYPDYKDLRSLDIDFEAFSPDEAYQWGGGKKQPGDPVEEWPIVVPVNAPPVPPDLPTAIQKMVEATWKDTAPSQAVARGKAGVPVDGHERPDGSRVQRWDEVHIGTRGMPQHLFQQFAQPDKGYRPQERPATQVLTTVMPDKSAIANDWGLFADMERVNAVTFRADKRPPAEVILNCRGFYPPNTRTDPAYTKRIAEEFSLYLWRRHGRTVPKEEILRVMNRELASVDDRELLSAFMVWSSTLAKEAGHLGRMVEHEFEKGWISTSKYLPSSMNFAITGRTPGWIYVTVVHGGFVVPFDRDTKIPWGTREAEIAKFGPLRADQIVGFIHYQVEAPHRDDLYGVPDTPIFFRKSFRKDEKVACQQMYKALSGGPSTKL
jgi:hypothetical protein